MKWNADDALITDQRNFSGGAILYNVQERGDGGRWKAVKDVLDQKRVQATILEHHRRGWSEPEFGKPADPRRR